MFTRIRSMDEVVEGRLYMLATSLVPAPDSPVRYEVLRAIPSSEPGKLNLSGDSGYTEPNFETDVLFEIPSKFADVERLLPKHGMVSLDVIRDYFYSQQEPRKEQARVDLDLAGSDSTLELLSEQAQWYDSSLTTEDFEGLGEHAKPFISVVVTAATGLHDSPPAEVADKGRQAGQAYLDAHKLPYRVMVNVIHDSVQFTLESTEKPDAPAPDPASPPANAG